MPQKELIRYGSKKNLSKLAKEVIFCRLENVMESCIIAGQCRM